jgi:glycosyltransferase involved in cell wall biosynthesis
MSAARITVDLVSAIVPVFNRPLQLQEAVASVLAQDWRPIEVIIVDDGSTDATPAVALALAQAHPGVVRVLTQPNGGPGLARERGRREARGEFIQYVDSDDILLPGKFSAQVDALRANPQCDVAYGMTRLRYANGEVAGGAFKDSGLRRDSMFPSFLLERWWDTCTPLYRRAICDRAGPWTDLRLEEDWEYDCRIAALGPRLAWCDRYVCEYRDHPGARLCRGEPFDPSRLAQRARAHALIYSHARSAGIGPAAAEMQSFARSLFLLARQCGAAGLESHSRNLFRLSCAAAGRRRSRGFDYLVYRALANLFGWQNMGRASHWIDSIRRGAP